MDKFIQTLDIYYRFTFELRFNRNFMSLDTGITKRDLEISFRSPSDSELFEVEEIILEADKILIRMKVLK